MPYHLSNHIYITQFRDELILLDLKQDKYMICFKEVSDVLLDLLEGKSPSFLSSEKEIIANFIADGIVEEKESLYLFSIDKKENSDGVENVDWRLPLDMTQIPLSLEVLKAFLTLVKVNFFIKFRGFYAAIQLIKRSKKNKENYKIPPQEELCQLANIVNKACLLYPTRTKCLEWAMTFVLLAIKRHWKCNLEIGIQNYPFMAHAWVECDGKVVMDEDSLRAGLGIILNEPFKQESV